MEFVILVSVVLIFAPEKYIAGGNGGRIVLLALAAIGTGLLPVFGPA